MVNWLETAALVALSLSSAHALVEAQASGEAGRAVEAVEAIGAWTRALVDAVPAVAVGAGCFGWLLGRYRRVCGREDRSVGDSGRALPLLGPKGAEI